MGERARLNPEILSEMRKAFVERKDRPTYEDLAKEFNVPFGTVAYHGAGECWPVLRNEYYDTQLRQADAKAIVLEVVRGDHVITKRYLSLAIASLEKMETTVARLAEEKSASTNAQTLNTVMFAAKNLSDALHNVGVIGAGKILKQAGKEDNGRWNPEMLHQLNVTVQNVIAGQQQPTPAAASAPVDVD